MLEPNVFEYSDYRDYLRAFYRQKKETRESYTYELFSKRAQIKSKNFLKLVIDRKKNLTTKTLLQFAQALKLGEAETLFFEALVLENQADSTIERKHYGDRLRILRPAKDDARTVRVSPKMNVFDHPLTPILIALAVGEEREAAKNKIESQLGFNRESIERTLKSFVAMDLIQLREDRYQCNFNHAVFHDGPSGIQLRKYTRAHLSYVMRAFEKHYTKGAKFYVHDMAINSKDFEALNEEIKRFISELNQKFDRVPGERGVSVNIQSFFLDSEITQVAIR